MPSVASGDGQNLEQARAAVIDDAPIIPASLVPEGASNPAFSQACWASDQEVFMAVDPATIDQIRHDSRIDAARAAHIDIFDAGCVTQGRKAQPGCQSLGITFCGFAINKQAQPFFKAQAFKHGARAALLMQGLRHTAQPDRLQAVASGMCQQGSSPFQW
jgi:hypothetical protein